MIPKVAFYVLLFGCSLASVQSLDVCEGQEDGARLAHPTDCSRFIQCHQGAMTAIRYCPFGLHFNRYESICDFKFRAGCEFTYALQQMMATNQLDCNACRLKCTLSDNGIQTIEILDDSKDQTLKGEIVSLETKGISSYLTTSRSSSTINPTSNSTKSFTDETISSTASFPIPTASLSSYTNSSIATKKSSTTSFSIPTAPTPRSTKDSTIETTSSRTYFSIPTAPIPSSTRPSSTILSTLSEPTAVILSCSKKSTSGENTKAPLRSSSVICGSSGKCVGQRDGTLLTDDTNNGYIVCQWECDMKMSCPRNLVFNAALQICDWPQS